MFKLLCEIKGTKAVTCCGYIVGLSLQIFHQVENCLIDMDGFM